MFPSELMAFTSHPACKIIFIVSTQGGLHTLHISFLNEKIKVSSHASKCSRVFSSLLRGFKRRNLLSKSVILHFENWLRCKSPKDSEHNKAFFLALCFHARLVIFPISIFLSVSHLQQPVIQIRLRRNLVLKVKFFVP